MPYHLVLEATRELPAVDQQWLVQALREDGKPWDQAPDAPEMPQYSQQPTTEM